MATRTSRPRSNPRARAASKPAAGTWGKAFPNSAKVYVEGTRGVRVPMREIALSGGEPPLRVYDATGPQGTSGLLARISVLLGREVGAQTLQTIVEKALSASPINTSKGQ